MEGQRKNGGGVMQESCCSDVKNNWNDDYQVAGGKGKGMGPNKASDALPLPLPVGLMNKVFLVIFFSAAYFLMRRWREKMVTSTPLHVVSLVELVAIVAQLASFVYLVGFFGIDYVQNAMVGVANDEFEGREELKSIDQVVPFPCSERERETKQVQVQLIKGVAVGENSDEDIAAAVCNGSVASYSLT
eukprot:Gb_37788 [translate_table: standard]